MLKRTVIIDSAYKDLVLVLDKLGHAAVHDLMVELHEILIRQTQRPLNNRRDNTAGSNDQCRS